ncbi:GAF domain-containing protein [Thermogemmatispora carboxidivorans]|uniref:GAF domain-containing protein n=1 Tax=Thermogemmatispora carboxidivorans TaxID=1382306 RepID=UPI00069B7B2D|nr:GAF domain-containing protein [Thermogemmatispora carboxidivorans]
MDEPRTWRELLGTIISDTHERQRLAEELGVTPTTLGRWVSSTSDPRPQNLRLLLKALPQYREQLQELIQAEFEDFVTAPSEDSSLEIPAAFYARIFRARATTTEAMRYWSLSNLILQQALGQLDPDHMGMAVRVVRCMPPKEGKIRSLREWLGLGTHPWGGELEHKAMFLSAESLSGYVVSSCRPNAIQNIDEEHSLIPAHRDPHERSAAAHPILYAGRVAGCFLVSSTQPYYFLSQARLTLIQQYADLLALAFDPQEFYDPKDIELRVMPDQSIQRQYFMQFRRRVSEVMMEATRSGHSLNNLQAEQWVWQELEDKLLELSLRLN